MAGPLFSTHRGIFDGVGDEVVQDGFQHLLIIERLAFLGIRNKGIVLLLLLRHIPKILVDALNERHEVAIRHMQM